MNRRQALTMLAAGAAGGPAVLRGARRTPGDKPNLLFVWTDQQRADTMAAYGNRTYKVPAMNRLAAESIVFDRCYVTQPVCTPSRSSILTGLWPHRSGCVNNHIALKPETKTLPELLAGDDYRTGYFGKWHLGDEVFAQHGFQEWAAIEDGYTQYFSEGRDRSARSGYHAFLANNGYKPGPNSVFSRSYVTTLPVRHSKPAYLAQEAENFILKHRNSPWLLYVNFLEPHSPFASALNGLHSPEEAPVPANYPGIPETPEPAWYRRRRETYRTKGFEGDGIGSREAMERLNRNYAGLCSLVDHAVARILWALESSGAADNTIVVYTSDHGEMMGSHSLLTKSVMYEESVRVPLLLRVPFRRQSPRRVTVPYSHIDTVPTLLDLLGKKDHPPLDGQSFVPALEGKARRDHFAFLQWTANPNDAVGGNGPDARTVVSPDGWKMVLHDTDQCLLFNRNSDPFEMRNLYGQPRHRDVQQRLRAKIEDWQQRTGDKMPLPAPDAVTPSGG